MIFPDTESTATFEERLEPFDTAEVTIGPMATEERPDDGREENQTD